ncbi:hypothetical protein [Nonomuraea sp. NPDC049158]|uniref:hypothetical protein n=1 Tax=Nonomuraea sp. NPDC049158 TaxID=3155649 RepID=UPI0033EC4563
MWQSWGRWKSRPPPSAAPGCACCWYVWRWRPGAPVTVEELAEALWPDERPADPAPSPPGQARL